LGEIGGALPTKRAKPGQNRKFKQNEVHGLHTQQVNENSQPPISQYPGYYMPLEVPQQYLRWLITVSSTFQDIDFGASLLPLVIT